MTDSNQTRIPRLTGTEVFHASGQALDFDVQSFWRWSASDLLGNRLRGILAEYLVGQAIGVASDTVREEWAAFDITSRQGVRIEVKCSAYIQSWKQSGPSTIRLGVRATRRWDESKRTYEGISSRQADVYVFAVLAHKERATVDPLNVSQWEFFCS